MTGMQTSQAATPPPARRGMLAAGARDLIALRDAGRHPRFVVVVLAQRWAARRYAPLSAFLGAPPPLMALADEVEARALSWFVLRGLGAVLVNADGPRMRRPVLLEAIAQIATEAAPVLLYSGGDMRDPESVSDDACDLLADARFDDPDGRWPGGWNSARHRDYCARFDRWLAEGDA